MSDTGAAALRVAHLTPAYFAPESMVGGGERYVYYLAQALRRVGGFEQLILAMGPAERSFRLDDIPVRVLCNESPVPNAMAACTSELWQALRGIDLVHIHQSLTVFGAYATAIARSLGIPAIGTDLGGGENVLMLAGGGLRLLDGVVSISRFAHDLIAGACDGPHAVLVGPVDTDHFAPAPQGARDRRLVLCVSRIMPHKGIDRVIAALPDGLRLIVAGRIYHEPYYRLLQDMAQGKDVQFVHDADDAALLDLYRRAGLFVQASTARDIYGTPIVKPELMGLTTLEALACGLPAAVSDTASLPELVPDLRFGRVFADDADLAAILLDVRHALWPAPEAGALARAHVLRHHGMAAIGQDLAALYRQVVARRRDGA